MRTVQGDAGTEATILVLCTANVCRSPLAARRISSAVSAAGIDDVRVRSAGTDADLGSPMCPQSAARLGRDAGDHRPREVTEALLRQADLVLALDRTHRAAAARIAPGCRPRLFTLRQAADLAAYVAQCVEADAPLAGAPPLPPGNSADVSIARLRWLVAEMDAARAVLAGTPEADADISDQHGPRDHSATLADVDDASTRFTTALVSVLQRG